MAKKIFIERKRIFDEPKKKPLKPHPPKKWKAPKPPSPKWKPPKPTIKFSKNLFDEFEKKRRKK